MGKYSDMVLEGKEKYSNAVIEEAPEQQAPAQPEMSELEQSFTALGLDIAQVMGAPAQGLINAAEGLNRFAQGPIQAGIEGLEKAGVLPEGSAEEYTKLRKADREAFDKQMAEEFGDNAIFSAQRMGAELAPWALVPGGQKTAAGRITASALSGGAAGGTAFLDEEESRLGGAATGAALGAGLSGLMEIPSAAQNKIRDFIASGLRNARNGKSRLSETFPSLRWADDLGNQEQAVLNERLNLGKRVGVTFKLSQVAPDPRIQNLERFVRDSAEGERLARSVEDKQGISLFRYWNRTMRELDPDNGDFPKMMREAFDQTLGSADRKNPYGLLGKRATEAARDFAAVGDDARIPLVGTINQLDELIEQYSIRGSGPQAKAIVKELGDLKDELANGEVSPIEMQALLENWGGSASGTGKVFTDAVDRAKDTFVARKIFSGLKDDLDKAADIPGAEALKTARDNYAKNSEYINVVRKSAVGKLFSGESDISKLTDEDIVHRVLKMQPSEIKETFSVLKSAVPSIEQSTQRMWLESFLAKSKIPGQADIYNTTQAKMLDMIKGEEREKFKAVFGDAESRKKVMDGLQAVRLIMINNNRSGGRTMARAKELAGVMASKDPTFASRLAAEIIAPKFLKSYLLDESGVKALQELARPDLNTTALSGAVTALYNIAKESEEDGNEME